jgi:hypothetical protein
VVATRENAAPAAEEITGETEFEIPTADGKGTAKVKLNALVESHHIRENGISGESEVEVDGKTVTVADLIASHQRLNAQGAETPEQKATRENAERVARENAEKKPAHFKVLMNAREKGDVVAGAATSPDSLHDRVARGAERYGKKTAGAN